MCQKLPMGNFKFVDFNEISKICEHLFESSANFIGSKNIRLPYLDAFKNSGF